jgi:hypothetical protein
MFNRVPASTLNFLVTQIWSSVFIYRALHSTRILRFACWNVVPVYQSLALKNLPDLASFIAVYIFVLLYSIKLLLEIVELRDASV